MKRHFRHSIALLYIGLALVAGVTRGQDRAAQKTAEIEWLPFPDSAKFSVLGIHWFDENQPQFWRMPAKQMTLLPKGVQNRSKFPAGGRIVLRCTTTRLALRAMAVGGGGLRAFAAYVNGQPCQPAVAGRAASETELVLFQNGDDREKEIVVYLPHLQEVIVQAIGVDRDAKFGSPEHPFARLLPVVFYGSSVCQGSGAVHPEHTYPAALCRNLNLDFVNLGFGGAGKAESNVVALVNSIPACCYVFDLGKSYGAQDATAFKAMLRAVRRSHPDIPLIAITPITSSKEVQDPSYSQRSIHTRAVMRAAVQELIEAGDSRLFLVEGEHLIGFKEHDLLSKDGVHPSDQGYSVIAARLAPVLKRALGL